MELAGNRKDGDVNSSEEERMMKNLWFACLHINMFTCRIVTIFIEKKKRKRFGIIYISSSFCRNILLSLSA